MQNQAGVRTAVPINVGNKSKRNNHSDDSHNRSHLPPSVAANNAANMPVVINIYIERCSVSIIRCVPAQLKCSDIGPRRLAILVSRRPPTALANGQCLHATFTYAYRDIALAFPAFGFPTAPTVMAPCVIRRKAATDSDAIRPPIPTEVGHPFRSKPATLVSPA